MKKKRSTGMQPDQLASGFRAELKKTVRHTGLAVCLAATSGLMLSACDSGSGGDNGRTPAEQQAIEDGPMGLVFSYPYNGQQNVTLTSQIAFRTQSAFDNDIADAIALRTASGDIAPELSINVVQDDNQPNVYRIQTSRPLRGNVTYRLVTTRALQSGDVRYDAGQTLFQFTTAPTPGAPSAGEFRVTEVAPGESNPVTGQTSIFAQFNTLHISLSETIDPSSVIDGETFTVTGPDGNDIEGALMVSGHEIAFDPADNLAPGDYTISLSGDVRSAFGKSLEPMSVTRTVLDSGDIVQQNLLVDNGQGFAGDADDSPLDGLMDNLVTIRTQLIGVNQQPARNQPERAGVLVNLSQPGMPGFGDVFPNSLPAGQLVQLKPLSVSLNGDVPTPLQSGPIQVQFGTDANVYLMANDYQDIATPTAVRLRFDLNNTTLIEAAPGTPEYVVQALANGVFNQSALNVQASGLAIPQDNGDLVITTLGTFPLTVNRSDDLTIDFSLTLRLPAGEQTPVVADNVAPFVISQTPSACLYTFGTPAYRPVYSQRGSAPTALPEQACLQVLQQGGALTTPSGINDFQIEGSPALTFSEPLDPLSVNGQSIQMTGPTGNVPVSFQVDGSSVVLRPDDLLQPNTQYTITLGSGSALRDLAGNSLVANPAGGPGQSIRFTTEPQVFNEAMQAPVILGELTPGVPCALEGGDFMSGGNDAGRCVGSEPADASGMDDDDDSDSMAGGMLAASATTDYPVFQNPKNVSVNVSFSKFVQRDTVVLADGCLTSGSGDDNSNNNATVALERIDGNGQCVGVPEASLAFLNTNDDTTRGFTIRPVQELTEGARYWIVICGNDGDASCGATILDTDGLALNTDPFNGTGTTPASQDAAGGPDIIMPFDAIGYTTDYYADQFTLPYTDTNGNGQFDDADGDGVYSEGDERPQTSNRALVNLSLLGAPITNTDNVGSRPSVNGAYPAYLSLTRPIAIRETRNDCDARLADIVDDRGNGVLGESPDNCIQVSLLPGGFSALTGIGINLAEAFPAIAEAVTDPLEEVTDPVNTLVSSLPVVGPVLGGTFNKVQDALDGLTAAVFGAVGGAIPVNGDPINTGQILLRFPNQTNDGGGQTAQSGYIVPECEGTLNGQAYQYEPCFVAGLNLVASAPDAQGLELEPQAIRLNLVGPVTFQQNGRLVIALNNANTFSLAASALGLLPATAEIRPGRLNFQLTGNEIHGGRAFPER